MEPERLAWKVFQLYHPSRASQVQPLGYGASILFSTLSTDSLQLPARLSGYVASFRALQPPTAFGQSVPCCQWSLNEPLFFGKQVTQPPARSPAMDNAAAATALTPVQKPLMLSAGVTKVAQLQLAMQQQQPQLLRLELQAVVSSAPVAAWFQALSTSDRQVIQHAQAAQLHTISPHLQLLPTFFYPVWITGELSTLCQVAKVPNQTNLRQNNGSETMCPSDQSMASVPQTGQAKRFGAMTTSRGSKAGHVMTQMCQPSNARKMAGASIRVSRPTHLLLPTLVESIPNPSQIISRDSSRPWRGSGHCSWAASNTCGVSCGAHTTYHLGCGAGAHSQPNTWWSSSWPTLSAHHSFC